MNTTSQLLRKSNGHSTNAKSRAPQHFDLFATELSTGVETSALNSIRESVQRYVQNLEIGIDDGAVVVTGRARSYHHRQLAEQKALLVARQLLNKRLVSEVDVRRGE